MTGGEVVGRSPGGEAGNLEVFERAFPCFDGVSGKDGIPIEAVDGETAMIDGWQELRDVDAVDVSLRAEINAGELHGNATLDAAAKNQCGEVGNVEAVFVEAIAAGAAQAALMKNVVGQENVGGRVVAGARELAVGESAFVANVDFSRRGERCAE